MSDINKTIREYDAIITKCESLFSKKMQDYGTSWRILRPSSLTDQIYIKAKRIRTLQQAGDSPLAAKEIGHLPVRSVPSFPILAHLVQDKPQVLREVRAPLVVELQVLLAR